jgi:hypothetical protein
MLRLKTTCGFDLKNIQKFRSPDGGGFNASIYKDGKRIGTVHQGGYGGCNEYHFKGMTDKDARMALKAAAAENGENGYESEDMFIEQLLNYKEDLKRCKKGTWFCYKGAPATQIVGFPSLPFSDEAKQIAYKEAAKQGEEIVSFINEEIANIN